MMQCGATLSAKAPLACKSVIKSKNNGRRSVAVMAHGDENMTRYSRRALAGFLAAIPVALPASRALALIPDDDDEEMVEKARANRKARLASEKKAEKAFSRSEGFVNKEEKNELVPVQRAVNSLALTGKQLSDGEVSAAASTLNGDWVSQFQNAADELSFNAGAKDAVSKVFSDLKTLQNTAQKGSLADTKAKYVAAVDSLQAWASQAGIASSLTGL